MNPSESVSLDDLRSIASLLGTAPDPRTQTSLPPAAVRDTTRTDALVAWLVGLIDQTDPISRGHSWRVSRLVDLAARTMGLPTAERRSVTQAALLHDVGKIVIPRVLLRKPASLRAEEFSIVQRHAELGARILCGMPALADAAPVARWHHERWDGGGYPGNLAGEHIPLAARLVSVLDAFDAMTSPRAYHEPIPATDALEELRAHAGTQFDPQLVALVCALDLDPLLEEFERIGASNACTNQIAA